MKKIAFILLLFAAYPAIAQTKMGHKYLFKGPTDSSFSYGHFVSFGPSFQQFDGLNNRVDNFSQYKELREAVGTIGFGSISTMGPFVKMMALNLGYSRNGKRDEKNSSLGFIGISGDLGYNLLKKESRLALFPTAGLGVELYRANFNKDISNVSFNDFLGSNATQNATRSVTFYNSFLTYRLGLNVAVKSPNQSHAIGLQAGYTGSFREKKWKINQNQTLDNTPSDGLSRVYVNLFFTREMKWKRKWH